MKLLPKRQLGIFLMVVSIVFLVAAGLTFFFFTIENLEDMGGKPVFEFPYRWLALPLALIGTGVFLAGLWLVLYPKEQMATQ